MTAVVRRPPRDGKRKRGSDDLSGLAVSAVVLLSPGRIKEKFCAQTADQQAHKSAVDDEERTSGGGDKRGKTRRRKGPCPRRSGLRSPAIVSPDRVGPDSLDRFRYCRDACRLSRKLFTGAADSIRREAMGKDAPANKEFDITLLKILWGD